MSVKHSSENNYKNCNYPFHCTRIKLKSSQGKNFPYVDLFSILNISFRKGLGAEELYPSFLLWLLCSVFLQEN
jgi:hypothetical protein